MDGAALQKLIEQRKGNPTWKEIEKSVQQKYGAIFNPQHLDQLTKEEFISFLFFPNNQHWTGLNQNTPLITADMDKLRNTLKYLLDENIEIETRLNQIFDNKESEYHIKGLGNARATAIMLVTYPTKYGVWNTKSEEALIKSELLTPFATRVPFSKRYLAVNKILLMLAKENNISLWELDIFLGEYSNNKLLPSSGTGEDPTVIQELSEENPANNFPLESHLEDFIIENWEKTSFGKHYDLIEDQEGNISKQYITDIGRIDILAKAKTGDGYLIIELKKGKTSDTVVGQTLRYMGWIRKHLAEGKNVKGTIVVLDTDDKLKYAVGECNNVQLYSYKVNFSLTEENI